MFVLQFHSLKEKRNTETNGIWPKILGVILHYYWHTTTLLYPNRKPGNNNNKMSGIVTNV